MATLSQKIAQLEKLTLPVLQEETRKIIQRSPELIKAKVNEFKRGETPEGNAIGFYRSPQYSLFKRRINPLAGGTVDLILTGGFTRGLIVESKGRGIFEFDSNDEKAPSLFAKYRQDLRGLNRETWLDIQRKNIAPELIKFIKRTAHV